MALLNEAHVKGEATQGASVIQNGRYLPPPEDKDGKVWVRTSAIIQAAPDKLYALWRDIESAPHWQEQLKQVVKTGEKTSHWIMYRGDKTIEWDSELLADEPGQRLAWRSIGGDLDTAGEVVFEAAPTCRGTMVTLLQEFKLGKLANLWETLTGRNPKQGVIENLRHFKALAETGEIPRTQGQPHGPRGMMGSGKALPTVKTSLFPTAPNRRASYYENGDAMKAVCWMGKNKLETLTVPDPTILNPHDAIIKVTRTAICGSDLHLFDGFIPTMESGDILGPRVHGAGRGSWAGGHQLEAR